MKQLQRQTTDGQESQLSLQNISSTGLNIVTALVVWVFIFAQSLTVRSGLRQVQGLQEKAEKCQRPEFHFFQDLDFTMKK